MTLIMDSNNGRKPRLASRSAKRHTQILKKPLILSQVPPAEPEA